MADYKNILIASDLGLETLELLDRARLLAKEDTHISIVHAIPPVGFTYAGVSSYVPDMLRYEEIENKIFEAKEEHVKEMIEYHKLHDVEWDIENGKPAKVIRERAEKTNCDLIIIGSHGEKGLRAILGSTATGVLHDAPCDVLCVRLFAE